MELETVGNNNMFVGQRLIAGTLGAAELWDGSEKGENIYIIKRKHTHVHCLFNEHDKYEAFGRSAYWTVDSRIVDSGVPMR